MVWATESDKMMTCIWRLSLTPVPASHNPLPPKKANQSPDVTLDDLQLTI